MDFTGSKRRQGDASFASLSAREREVLARVSAGLSNPEIASSLSISEKTVKNHITRVFEKLDVSTRSQAIVKARDGGFSE